jgi:hypothetical protein
MLALRWAGSPLLLRTLMLMLVKLSRWVGGAMVVHHLVLWRSTTGWWYLGAAQEPKLALHHLKPVVGLKMLSCLGEERWVRS